jgi:hypothetical protein
MPNFKLLREAAAIIDGIPSKLFDLNLIMQADELEATDLRPVSAGTAKNCGAIGCAIGWLGTHPDFNALGLETLPAYAEEGGVCWQGKARGYNGAAAALFGINYGDARNLFAGIGSSDYDADFQFERPNATSKQVFKNRVRRFLAEHSEPVNPAF